MGEPLLVVNVLTSVFLEMTLKITCILGRMRTEAKYDISFFDTCFIHFSTFLRYTGTHQCTNQATCQTTGTCTCQTCRQRTGYYQAKARNRYGCTNCCYGTYNGAQCTTNCRTSACTF